VASESPRALKLLQFVDSCEIQNVGQVWRRLGDKIAQSIRIALNHMRPRPRPGGIIPKIKLRNRWLVYFVRGDLLGPVEALTEQAAIELAIEKYKITKPELQRQLVARRYRYKALSGYPGATGRLRCRAGVSKRPRSRDRMNQHNRG
jgi:hypothetical protein